MNNTDINVTKRNKFYRDSLLHFKKKASGEIFKEPFLDILLTDVEQTSFSLIEPKLKKEDAKHLKEDAKHLKEDAKHLKEIKNGERVVISKQSKGVQSSPFTKPLPDFVLVSPVRVTGNRLLAKRKYFLFASTALLLPTSTLHKQRKTKQCKKEVLPFRKYVHQGLIKLIAEFWNNNLRTSNYLFALDKCNNRDIFLTSYFSFLFNSNAKNKQTFLAKKRATKLNFSNSLQNKKPISCLLKIGDYVHCGDKVGYLSGAVSPLIISESGKILKISKTQVTIQKMQPVLFYSQAEIHVENNEWVKRGTPLLTLAHQTLVTGDIVQGIPRIEQLFEASSSAPPGVALQDFDFYSEDSFAKPRKGRKKVTVAGTSSLPKLDKISLSSNLSKNNVLVDTLPKRMQSKVKKESGIPKRSFGNNTYLESQHTSHLLSSNSDVREASNGTVEQNQTLSELNLNRNQFLDGTTQPNYNSTVHFVTEEKPFFLYQTLQSQVRETLKKKWNQLPLALAVRQSLEEIQQIIVESIQKVYISQGVLIADKHIEIIVRQMTCKAQIFDGGSTGLLIDEILSLQQIESANISTPGQKAVYLPVIMGLTRAALSSDSFVSAASFQETTRVLSRDALAGKTDFLRGLKEKVIIGDLIDAGTGLDVFYIYSLFSKSIFENKLRDILNRKITHKTLKNLVLPVTKSYPN